MRPVVICCWFFLFFCLACASNERSDVQASIATTAAAASTRAGVKKSLAPLSLSMRVSDLLRRGGVHLFFEQLATVSASRARAEREQTRTEEEQRRRLRRCRRRGRRAAHDALRRVVVMIGRADARAADYGNARARPPREAARRDVRYGNLAAVADRAGYVAEVNSLHVTAALRKRTVGRCGRRARSLRGLLRGGGLRGGRRLLLRGRAALRRSALRRGRAALRAKTQAHLACGAQLPVRADRLYNVCECHRGGARGCRRCEQRDEHQSECANCLTPHCGVVLLESPVARSKQ